jgi:urea carboxylase
VSGSVWQVEVEEGAMVKAGQTLLVLESMKMEIPVQAPCDGVVSQMLLEPGSRVSAGKALVVLSDS